MTKIHSAVILYCTRAFRPLLLPAREFPAVLLRPWIRLAVGRISPWTRMLTEFVAVHYALSSKRAVQSGAMSWPIRRSQVEVAADLDFGWLQLPQVSGRPGCKAPLQGLIPGPWRPSTAWSWCLRGRGGGHRQIRRRISAGSGC